MIVKNIPLLFLYNLIVQSECFLIYKNMKGMMNNIPYDANCDVGEALILTPMIEAGQLKEAREAAHVEDKSLFAGFESYSAFLTVDKRYNSNLFFWYFPVPDKKVEDTPWILWLQGGPGASSIFGVFEETGPLFYTANGTVEEMKYNWGKNHSILIFDNPVGTGFSFTNDEKGFATNQTQIGKQLYDALQEFLQVFPELRKAPFFIVGESYAGKHIPSLAWQIHRKRDQNKPINMQGIAIGDGFIDPITLLRYSYFTREVGLLDDHDSDKIKNFEVEAARAISNGEYDKAHNFLGSVLAGIETGSAANIYNYLEESDLFNDDYIDFITRPEVRKALHVGCLRYAMVNGTVFDSIQDFTASVKPWFEELIDHYRVMCYSGQLDVIVAYYLSVNTHHHLTFHGMEEYMSADRQHWAHGGHSAGYWKAGGKFTEVLVRRAGHCVPKDAPGPALGLISAFVRDVPLSQDTANLSPI